MFVHSLPMRTGGGGGGGDLLRDVMYTSATQRGCQTLTILQRMRPRLGEFQTSIPFIDRLSFFKDKFLNML